MKRIKLAIIFNIIIIVMDVFATILMITGIQIIGHSQTLTETGYHALQFFTVDSNLLVLATSILMLIYYLLMMNKKIEALPNWLKIVRLCSVVGVTLTMLTTVFYLGFIVTTGYLSLFYNANLFYHLLVPLFSIISFILFEQEVDLKKNQCFYGLIPTVLYSIYYITNVFTHYDHGVSNFYDFYGFAQGGVIGMIISFIVMLGITLLISFVLLLVKNGRRKENA